MIKHVEMNLNINQVPITNAITIKIFWLLLSFAYIVKKLIETAETNS